MSKYMIVLYTEFTGTRLGAYFMLAPTRVHVFKIDDYVLRENSIFVLRWKKTFH